jgi:hypothetical protein
MSSAQTVLGLAAALLVAGSGTALAQVGTFTGWACVLDLKDALGGDFVALAPLPAQITTTTSEKRCTGSAPGENIQIQCSGQVPGWAGGNKVYNSFPCQIFRGQCGGPGFVHAEVSRLSINSSGSATLTCNRNDS